MRRDAKLGQIINSLIGGCKHLPRQMIIDLPSALKGYHYVRDNEFTDLELEWHISIIVTKLFDSHRSPIHPDIVIYKHGLRETYRLSPIKEQLFLAMRSELHGVYNYYHDKGLTQSVPEINDIEDEIHSLFPEFKQYEVVT